MSPAERECAVCFHAGETSPVQLFQVCELAGAAVRAIAAVPAPASRIEWALKKTWLQFLL